MSWLSHFKSTYIVTVWTGNMLEKQQEITLEKNLKNKNHKVSPDNPRPLLTNQVRLLSPTRKEAAFLSSWARQTRRFHHNLHVSKFLRMHLNLYVIYSWQLLILDPFFILFAHIKRWHSPIGKQTSHQELLDMKTKHLQISPAVLLHHILETDIAKSLFYCYFYLAALLFCEPSPWSFSVLPSQCDPASYLMFF